MTSFAVVISGAQRRNVSSAITQVEVIAENGRRKSQFTHFVSIPVNADNIQSSFVEFQNIVMEKFSGVSRPY